MRNNLALAAVCCWLAFLTSAAQAAEVKRGLSTGFVEVLIEGVPVGSRYVLEGKTVDVFNNSELSLKFRYDAMEPSASEMRAGYEPIPDPAWISFEPRTFDLMPSRTSSGKLVLYIPDDPALVGKRYQTMLVLHTDPSQGGMVGIGLKPRLLFSITGKTDAKGPTRIVNNPPMLARLVPYELVGAGPFLEFDCGILSAQNFWEEPMTYEVFVDAAAAKRIDVRSGEVLVTDPAWIEVHPQAVALPRNGKAELSVTARLPVSAEIYGKTYVAALRTVARRKGGKDVEIFNRIQINVPRVDALPAAPKGEKRDK